MGLVEDMKANKLLGEYFSLRQVLKQALDQAEKGKGKERHAEAGEPFERQIICEVARRVGLGYPLGQAVKKIYESQRLGGVRGMDELLGAINYIAAAYIVMQERVKAETAKEAAEFSAALDKTADEMNAKVLEGVMKHAEGCEELVQKDLHEDCEGCLYRLEADAPQTKEELIERIKDVNPAIYGAHVE